MAPMTRGTFYFIGKPAGDLFRARTPSGYERISGPAEEREAGTFCSQGSANVPVTAGSRSGRNSEGNVLPDPAEPAAHHLPAIKAAAAVAGRRSEAAVASLHWMRRAGQAAATTIADRSSAASSPRNHLAAAIGRRRRAATELWLCMQSNRLHPSAAATAWDQSAATAARCCSSARPGESGRLAAAIAAFRLPGVAPLQSHANPTWCLRSNLWPSHRSTRRPWMSRLRKMIQSAANSGFFQPAAMPERYRRRPLASVLRSAGMIARFRPAAVRRPPLIARPAAATTKFES